MLVIHNGFIIPDAYIRKWFHSSDIFDELYQAFGTHFCTILNNAKYPNSFFVLPKIGVVRVRKFYMLIKL